MSAPIKKLLIALCLRLVVGSSNQCFQHSYGTVNRSATAITLATHPWESHVLTSALVEIVLTELLGFRVLRRFPERSDHCFADIAAGDYDVDIEQWNVDSATDEFFEYVTVSKQVFVAGETGYTARSGLHTFRSTLEANQFADYFKFYQNGTDALLLGFPGFQDSQLRGILGNDFPVCDPQYTPWCGTGDWLGYWAPAACQLHPAACVEIFKSSPQDDEGYFEQLINENGLQAFVGYYGEKLEERVESSVRPILFHTWRPSTLVAKLDLARISFEDYSPGCDSGNTLSPLTGDAHCDKAEIVLQKVVSQRVLEQAPEAYFSLSMLQVSDEEMETILLSTARGGGPHSSPFEAACAFLLADMDKVGRWAPACISNPAPVVDGQAERFNAELLLCENVTVLPSMKPLQCFGGQVGTVDRNTLTVRVAVRDWLTHYILGRMLEVVLREFLGYNVIMLDAKQRLPPQVYADIADGLFDVDMESWWYFFGDRQYIAFIETGRVLFAGHTGFLGKQGLYAPQKAFESDVMIDYYRFYWNATLAAAAGFLQHRMSPLHNATRENCDATWCGSGELEGFYATESCLAYPGECLEVAHNSPLTAAGYFEQVANNLGLPVVFAYYGYGPQFEWMPDYADRGKFALFYWWTPDTYHYRIDSTAVSLPDSSSLCALPSESTTPDGAGACEYPSVKVAKFASQRMGARTLAEAFYAVNKLQIFQDDWDAYLPNHITAGGNRSSDQLVCDFLRANVARLSEWAPDCMVFPANPADVQVNDVVFSADEGDCKAITCPRHQILSYREDTLSFECDACPSGDVADGTQRYCVPCPSGTKASDNAVACEACLPGRFSLHRSSECSPCEAGSFAAESGLSACTSCPAGTQQGERGESVCVDCQAGRIAQEPAALTCIACFRGFFQPNRSATACARCPHGTFASVMASTACDACEYGTTQTTAAEKPEDCACPAGTFKLDSACVECNLAYMLCPGGIEAAQQKAGYVVSIDASTIYRCPSQEACPGGIIGTCPEGSSGPACAACDDQEYVWNGTKCKECSPGEVVFLIFVAIAAVMALLVTHTYGNDPVSLRFSMTSEFIVMMGLLANVFFALNAFAAFNVEWHEPLATLVSVSSSISNELTRMHVGCSGAAISNVQQYVLSSLVPGATAVVFFALGALRWASPRKLFNSYATMTYSLYLLLVMHGVKPFRFIVHPGAAGKSVLDVPAVLEGSNEYFALVVCGILVLLVYCIPFALACIVATIRIRRTSKNLPRRWWLIVFRFLFYKFRPEFHHWGLCILLRNAMFALGPSLAPANPKIGLFLLSVIAAASAAHTAIAQPWRHMWMTVVDVAIQCYILLVLHLAAGWAHQSEFADTFIANVLVALGCAGAFMLGGAMLHVFLARTCMSDERRLQQQELDRIEFEEEYLGGDPRMEHSEHLSRLCEAQSVGRGATSRASVSGRDSTQEKLAHSLLLISREVTKLSLFADIAAALPDPEYTLQHYYEDCIKAMPELRLYDVDELEVVPKTKSVASQVLPRTAQGGNTMAEEKLRTLGALFAIYCLCRLNIDGKEILSFGVNAQKPHLVNKRSSEVTKESLEGMPWGRMNAVQRRTNFYWNFEWDLMESLFVQAGILLHDDKQELRPDVRPEGRLVAMLSLTAYHDIMKDTSLCPVVARDAYEGYEVGELIHDHDLALAYVLDRHPGILPSFRILSPEQQKLVRFTQSEMGFNAGWLVQAEGPPSAVLSKLKKAIQSGGAKDSDVAFYFVHWVTDLAGAEPTPFSGSEKFAAKFPPFVLQGLLGCFSIVKMLADRTETEVYEAYLVKRWREAAVKSGGVIGLRPSGREAVARMRLLCMAQGGAPEVLKAFGELPAETRSLLSRELAETGLPGQQYQDWQELGGPCVGTPFLLYYGPAWCQRAGQAQPQLTLTVLAEVFQQARETFPESLDVTQDEKDGIASRTIQCGMLKTTDLEALEADGTDGGTLLVVLRESHLEGTLDTSDACHV